MKKYEKGGFFVLEDTIFNPFTKESIPFVIAIKKEEK